MDALATTIDHGTGSHTAAPDWNHVPFDVGCARCGRDLRGLTEPKCPACALEFDWSDAVPIEHLTCENCGYHIYGLQEPRCPECGETFEWQDVLAAFHRRKQMLFEYHWRTKPVRSLLATWRRSLRPGKLWRELDIHDPPAVRPLIAQVVIFAVLAWSLTVMLSGVLGWIGWLLVARDRGLAAPGWAVWFRELVSAVRNPYLYVTAPLICGGTAITMLSLLLLRQSMRRYRVRNVHVLRVCAYAIPPLIVPALLVEYSYLIVVTLLGWGYRYWVSYIIGALVLIFVVWSIRQGYRKYLKMPHSLGIAIASQAIAVTTLAVLCDALSAGPSVVGQFYEALWWMMSLLNW
jgi:ribosomal protein L37E